MNTYAVTSAQCLDLVIAWQGAECAQGEITFCLSSTEHMMMRPVTPEKNGKESQLQANHSYPRWGIVAPNQSATKLRLQVRKSVYHRVNSDPFSCACTNAEKCLQLGKYLSVERCRRLLVSWLSGVNPCCSDIICSCTTNQEMIIVLIGTQHMCSAMTLRTCWRWYILIFHHSILFLMLLILNSSRQWFPFSKPRPQRIVSSLLASRSS